MVDWEGVRGSLLSRLSNRQKFAESLDRHCQARDPERDKGRGTLSEAENAGEVSLDKRAVSPLFSVALWTPRPWKRGVD